MNIEQMTQKTREALQAAQRIAVEYSNNAVEQEHLLAALAQQQDGLIPQMLQTLGVDANAFANAALQKVEALPRVTGSGRDPEKIYISGDLDRALNAAEQQAKQMKDEYISVEHVRVGLFDLIKQHDAVRMAAHGLGQLAALLIADISRRRTDQTRDAELLHILGHVDTDHVLLIVKQSLGQRLGKFGLADARGAEEQEAADGAVRIGDTRAGA